MSSPTEGRTTLVTGAGGFIGSALVDALLRTGHDIAALDRDESRLARLTRHPDAGRLRVLLVDITNPRAVADAVAESKPTSVVHLAALHLIAECEARPRESVAVNIDGLLNVLSAADRSPAEFLLFASSADVYAPSKAPLAESEPARPSSVYGATKLLGERLVAEWADRGSGRRATSMRIFNVYGAGDSNPHVIPDIVERLRLGRAIQVGNVESMRDFIHVDDLVAVMCRALDSSAAPAVINAGTGRATSIAQLLDTLQKLVDRPFTWVSDPSRIRANDRRCLHADVSELASFLPRFGPRPLETGLAGVLAAAGVASRARRRW